MAVRYSATASSIFPCPRRAVPRLLWALAWSGWSRMAVRNSATTIVIVPDDVAQDRTEVVVGLEKVGIEPDGGTEFGDGLVPLPLRVQDVAEVVVGLGGGLEPDDGAEFGDGLVPLPLGRQDVAEAVVGPGVVGIEPDGGAEFGDGLVPLPLRRQDVAEAVVGLGVVGIEPDGGAVCDDGPLEERRRVGGPALLLQVSRQAAQVPRVLRPSIRQIAEDRFGLVAAAHALEHVGQLVRRSRQGAGRRVVPHRLLARPTAAACPGCSPGRG